MSVSNEQTHIPAAGAVDDRGTMDSQLPCVAKQSTVPRLIAIQLHKYLEDMRYPATKDELYLHAASRGAPMNTLNHLRTMQRTVYDSVADVDNELKSDAQKRLSNRPISV